MYNREYASEKQESLLAEALKYAASGWPVFPCKPDKSPYVSGAFKSATTDSETIRDWWTKWPDAMIAAPTGKGIGAWVLDVDDEAAFASVASDLGLPATRTSRTGKGRHFYFAYDEAEPILNAQKPGGLPGADIRGEGGYVILPPSIHPSGVRYTWERNEDASEASTALMAIVRAHQDKRPTVANDRQIVTSLGGCTPVRVLDLGLRLAGPGTVSQAALLAMAITPVGQRSEAVNHFIAEAVREGWTDGEITGTLLHRDNAISERILEQHNPVREINRAVWHYRTQEGIADGEVPHIRDYPVIDWDAFIASAKRGKPKAAANDGDIGIVRHDPQATGRKPFEFVRVGEIEYNEPDWLIDGLFEASSLALLFGDPGAGKSFIAIDLSASVATGTPFHGRDVVQGAVFIIAGEGFSGLRRRFSAWEQGTGVLLNNAPLYVSKGAANFLDAESALRVAEAVAKLANKFSPRLIVVDTLARSFGDGDENNTKDMNIFVRAMDELRRDYPDATVLVVHHCGHAEKGRARGAMALKGALDAEYKTSKTGTTVTLSNTKMKESDTPKPMHFELVNVELGTDRHGEPFGSVRLKLKEGLNAGEALPGFKGHALTLLNAYDRIASDRERAGEESGVPRKLWREAFCAAHGGARDSARTMFSRIVNELCASAPTEDDGLCFLSESTIARRPAS